MFYIPYCNFSVYQKAETRKKKKRKDDKKLPDLDAVGAETFVSYSAGH